MASELPDIPHNMRRVYRRFQQWRSAHTGRLRIPERLWAAAVGLAREHGVFRTSKVLRSRVRQAEAVSGSGGSREDPSRPWSSAGR